MDSDDKDIAMSVLACRSSKRAYVLELLTEVDGPELWPGMVEFATASCTDLDQFRACHVHGSCIVN